MAEKNPTRATTTPTTTEKLMALRKLRVELGRCRRANARLLARLRAVGELAKAGELDESQRGDAADKFVNLAVDLDNTLAGLDGTALFSLHAV